MIRRWLTGQSPNSHQVCKNTNEQVTGHYCIPELSMSV
jgi:hypothetical protein